MFEVTFYAKFREVKGGRVEGGGGGRERESTTKKRTQRVATVEIISST